MKLYADYFADEEIKADIISNKVGNEICSQSGKDSAYVNHDFLLDFFKSFFSIYQLSSEGTPLINLIQSEWNLFIDSSLGIQIVDVVAQELGLKLRGNLLVNYVDDILNDISPWDEVKRSLMYERRFFAVGNDLIDHNWDAYLTLTETIDGNTDFYRARINKEDLENPYSTSDIGCPPSKLATAGRANPTGIPYLYLCLDARTTLFETRCSYLDIVTIGKFNTLNNDCINLVNFTNEGSPYLFNDQMIPLTTGRLLRKRISEDLSRPLRRYDTELEYVPTQFICEFIRTYAKDARGILFNSSLCKGGVNVVIFDPKILECAETRLCKIDSIDINGVYLDDSTHVV